ncbi:hypothetical protein LCGC14_2409790 [marine sediment metagenome]|uniref:Uncharacterized protein n=1 Tax=marine sediment metagenome TaxID=412755 RepID=A0A0F9EM99_9ZZZZ
MMPTKQAFEKWWENVRKCYLTYAKPETAIQIKDVVWEYFHRPFPRDLREVITKALESEGYSPVEGLVGIIMSLMKGEHTVELIKKPVCPTCGGRLHTCGVPSCYNNYLGHLRSKPDPEYCRENCLSYRPCPDCKPCETCGGSLGHICADGEFRKWSGVACSNCNKAGLDPCPACTEKPQRTDNGRTGQQRKGRERRDISFRNMIYGVIRQFSPQWVPRDDRREEDRRG